MFLVLNKKRIVLSAFFIFILVSIILLYLRPLKHLKVNTQPKGYVAIIIDDFGNYSEGTEKMLNLGIPLTVAVMPFLPSSKSDAYKAHEKGLDVIMHIAMEPVYGRKEWLGPNAITVDLQGEEIKKRINSGLDELKYCVGMNNHMGSKVTQNERVMKAVLEVAKERDITFIDSKTTPNSIVFKESNKLGIVSLSRDVFLDNIKQKQQIKNQLYKLGNLALQNGYAIGIGHVGIEGGTVTAESIKEMYPILKRKGIKFVLISDIIELEKSNKKRN